MLKQGMFIVPPYSLPRNSPQLRISHLGCVPQINRRPRMINDHTFSGINPVFHKIYPPEAMQWVQTLHLILWLFFNSNQRHGGFLLSKTYLSDAFYQIQQIPSGELRIAVPFPKNPNNPKLVAIPTQILIGCNESPPAFSATTETISGIANELLECSPCIPPSHTLKHAASTYVPIIRFSPDAFPIHESGPILPTLDYVEVCVDNFVKLAQGWIDFM